MIYRRRWVCIRFYSCSGMIPEYSCTSQRSLRYQPNTRLYLQLSGSESFTRWLVRWEGVRGARDARSQGLTSERCKGTNPSCLCALAPLSPFPLLHPFHLSCPCTLTPLSPFLSLCPHTPPALLPSHPSHTSHPCVLTPPHPSQPSCSCTLTPLLPLHPCTPLTPPALALLPPLCPHTLSPLLPLCPCTPVIPPALAPMHPSHPSYPPVLTSLVHSHPLHPCVLQPKMFLPITSLIMVWFSICLDH